MNKTFLFSIISLLLFGGANATVCRLIPTKCYTTMGAGYFYDTSDPESWDITSNCWGKKYICVDALSDTYVNSHNVTDRAALGRKEIADSSRINSDFDLAVLNGDCFGARLVKDGGAAVKVDGNYVNVWCSGILDDLHFTIKDSFDNGDTTSGAQPTCSQLSTYGYVNIQNGKCYGKQYNLDEYRVQCNGDNPTLIVLNGADPDSASNTTIKTKPQATAQFNVMFDSAKKLHKDYFKD